MKATPAASVSVIISFYREVDQLALTLAALEVQQAATQAARKAATFEIIIADDGSPPEIVTALSTMLDECPIASRHVHHEDLGFRKTRILNRAVEAASGEYLVFIDMDCIPHPSFVRAHVQYRERGVVLEGRRVHLSPKITSALTPEAVRAGTLQSLPVFIDGILGKTHGMRKGFLIRNRLLRRLVNRSTRGLVGSNFSLHREDLLAVNGFDERYEAPGTGEDADLQVRLQGMGCRLVNVHNQAIQYHLHHAIRERSPHNRALLDQVKADHAWVTPYGITSAAVRSDDSDGLRSS